ncbi:RibD family protein [Frigidibacter sp. MR17.24]|uniref:RibD family protein n=1 Tax=Frigidibacter sp. MR17.24 TaxID=3127345 RepID=UPI0030130853
MRQMVMSETLWSALLRYRETGTLPAARLRAEAGWQLYAPLVAHGAERVAVAQVGQSLDGRVATPAGDARDISGADGIGHLHRMRAMCDAVIVGVGTVIADDPSLSVRAVPGRSPVRVVVDCNATMPAGAQMLRDDGTPVLLIRAADAPASHARGTDEIRLPRGPAGLCPAAILSALAARGLTSVLVEGGARTIARFLEARLLQHLHVAVAPLIIGSGPTGLSLAPVERLAQAHRPEISTYDLGSDMLFDCRLAEATPAAAATRRTRSDEHRPEA